MEQATSHHQTKTFQINKQPEQKKNECMSFLFDRLIFISNNPFELFRTHVLQCCEFDSLILHVFSIK